MNDTCLDRDLRAFAGLGPGGTLNYGYADAYFWNYMKVKYNKTGAELTARLAVVLNGVVEERTG
jgi:hypothetical protein